MTRRVRGFTLIELVVATAVAGVVGAGVISTLVRQQRFYGAAGGMLSVRAQLRDAADVLASDIRSAAVASYGLPLMADSAIEMVTSVASSVLCNAPSGVTLGLPPATLSNGNTLTSILAQPDAGDIVMMYGIPSTAGDTARWEASAVVSFVSRPVATVCPATTGFTTTADAAALRAGYSVTVAWPPSPAVRKGAPIRFLRRVRYSLYRSADSRWYLGYRKCGMSIPSTCAGVQPVSGPYDSYSPGVGSGLTFRYYDAAGSEVPAASTGKSVARVEIVLRGASAGQVMLAGDSRRLFTDSTIVAVSPRNRRR